MSKKLNIIEAMKMPIGTRFDFDIEAEAEYIEILKGLEEKKILCWDGNKHAQINICTSTSEMKLTPIQQPVSFMEAVVNPNNKIKVILSNKDFFSVDIERLNKYMSIKELFKELTKQFSDGGISKVITKGKWYIEESDSDE